MKNFKTLALVAFGLLASSLSAQYSLDKIDLSIFPKAEKGMVQYVVEVPHSSMEDDANKKIEILVGKNTQTDKCNRYFLNGDLKENELKGFGYTYYTFKSDGNVGSTMMGCGDTGTTTKFVTAKPTLMDYNGRMPIVIYAPEGFDVQYKIYKAEPEKYRAYQVKQKK